MTTYRAKYKILCVCLTAISLVGCLFVLPIKAKADRNYNDLKGRILFISSFSYAREEVKHQIDGMIDALPADVALDFEFMDVKQANDTVAEELFYESLQYKLSKTAPYDAVILGNDVALRFGMKYQDELFAGIPLIFECVRDVELAQEAAKNNMITGVIEKKDLESNIKLGFKLNPEAVRVVAILDNSPISEGARTEYYQLNETFPELEFKEINAAQFTEEELKTQLKRVSQYSILLYISMGKDVDGKNYSQREAIELIAENANVPALCLIDIGIGDGILGGNVVSMSGSGRLAVQMALDIMDGKDLCSRDTVVDSPNIYCIDNNVLNKAGMRRAALPKGTVIMNQEESFFQRNKEAMIPAGVLITALLVVIAVICLDNVRGRKMQKELEEAKTIMESASQHDFLTGLPNRSKFMEDLEQFIAQKKACTVIMLDIDDFKKINDSYGHTAGDEALQQVAARLKEMTSPILSAYRFAGDEFIMIQLSSQRKIVEKTAYQCRQLFSKPFLLSGEKRKICGSIGLACYPDDTEDLEQLIIYADDAMYQVKKNGKNDFAFYQKPEE